MAQQDFHPDEWNARVELAACYRIFAMLGWAEMIYNHITVRVPESAIAGSMNIAGLSAAGNAAQGTQSYALKQFLINPFGLHYSEVTASNLIKIDTQGNKLHPSPHPVNPAGFTVHSAIHNALPAAHCVMHTHTTTGSAVACTASGLAQNNFYSAQLHDMVAYHDFEGITVHAEETPRLIKAMGEKPLVILRNHGLLAYSATLPLAFVRLWTLQRACDVQCMQANLGPAIAVLHDVAQRTTRDGLQYDERFGAGQNVFDAQVRLLDKFNPGYAQ